MVAVTHRLSVVVGHVAVRLVHDLVLYHLLQHILQGDHTCVQCRACIMCCCRALWTNLSTSDSGQGFPFFGFSSNGWAPSEAFNCQAWYKPCTSLAPQHSPASQQLPLQVHDRDAKPICAGRKRPKSPTHQ